MIAAAVMESSDGGGMSGAASGEDIGTSAQLS